MSSELKVGVIGLGVMGWGMASCLMRAGFEVTGFDIQRKAVERLMGHGGRAADSPRDAADKADVLAIVVATADQALAALFDKTDGALWSLPRGSAIVCCITASPDFVVSLEQRIRDADRMDIRLLDCPISGGEVRAFNGTLSLLCAAKEAADVDFARPVLDCLSSQVHFVPGGVGAGSKLKLIHQILVGVHIVASNEVMGLAYVAGLNLQSVHDTVMSSKAASWLFGQRASHILDESKVPASSLAIITKDMDLVTAYGDRHEVALPLSSAACQLFKQTQSAGWGPGDDCHIINAYLLGRGQLQSLRNTANKIAKTTALDEDAICNLLIGIHCTVAVEVIRFAQVLELDVAILQEVVQHAAGSSFMFNKICGQAVGGGRDFSLGHVDGFGIMRNTMAKAIAQASSLGYPMFLTSTTLQQFYAEPSTTDVDI